MKPMNVMVLTPWYPTQDQSYSGVFVREYAKAVQKHCNVTVLHCGIIDETYPKWWTVLQENDKALTEGIPTYRVLYRRSWIAAVSSFRRHVSVYRAIVELSKERGRPDLLHAHVYSTGKAALLAGKMLGVPVVISEHSSRFFRGTLSYRKLCEARIIFRMADAVLPVSEALLKKLRDNGIKAAFQVVPNVIDTDLFHYEPQHLPLDRSLRLLAVSSLVKHKGLAYLFDALTKVDWKDRSWRLDVVGDGPEAAQHHQMVNDLKLSGHVTFHGQVFKKEVAHMMRTADLFILPSLIETFSVVTAEALACGLPVLVTRCGGPEGFVNDHAGMIVAPGNADELAEALTHMIDSLHSYDRAVIAGQAKERFAAASVSETLCGLYERLYHDRIRSRR
jgi:L-malate glycosyltransferase